MIRKLLPWVRFVAPVVVKKVRGWDSGDKRRVGFVQKWEVASWQKAEVGPGWVWRTEYSGASRVRSLVAARRARAGSGSVRVTYRGR